MTESPEQSANKFLFFNAEGAKTAERNAKNFKILSRFSFLSHFPVAIKKDHFHAVFGNNPLFFIQVQSETAVHVSGR